MQDELSAQSVKRLKPAADRYEVWDTGCPGLLLRVETSGRKTWLVRYRARGLRRRLKLGTYPALGLSAARKAARKRLGQVDLGGDPAADRGAARKALTLSDLVKGYIEDATASRAARTNQDYENTRQAVLEKGTMGATLADEVRRPELKAWLVTMAKDTPVRANRVLALVRAAYRWGLRESLVKADPTAGGFRRPGRETASNRVLTDDEVKAVWTKVDKLGLVVAGAIKIMLLCGTRRTETLTARRGDVDLKDKLWHIPGDKRKGGRALTVPLTDMAVAVFKSVLPAAGPGADAYVFAGPKGASIGANASRWCVKLEKTTGAAFSLHDLRRTCATGCAKLGAAPHVISKILGHQLPAGALPVTALVYDRADRVDVEVRPALNAWSAHVAGVLAGKKRRGNVSAFARR